jgi:hypothetical protein
MVWTSGCVPYVDDLNKKFDNLLIGFMVVPSSGIDIRVHKGIGKYYPRAPPPTTTQVSVPVTASGYVAMHKSESSVL